MQLDRRLAMFLNLIPLYDVPIRLQIIGPPILVKQIVRVLPYIDTKNRFETITYWIVLIGCGSNFEFALLIQDEPRPAATKAPSSRCLKFLLELIEAAEGGINGVSQLTRWRSSGIWTQNFPKE